MKKLIKYTSIFLIILMVFTASFTSLSAAAKDDTVITVSEVQPGDMIDDGIIVADDASYCGCCHSHNHGSDIGGRISCIFCKITTAIKRIFGVKEKNAVHKYQVQSFKAPTCTVEGEYILRCAQCGVTKAVPVSVTIHDIVTIPAEEPTCTKAGFTQGRKCSVCGEILIAQTRIAPPGHTEITVNAKDATCETEGYSGDVVCSVCGEVITNGEAIGKKAHTPSEAAVENKVEATCKAEGSYDEVIYCSVCDTEISRTEKTTAKLAHTEAADEAVAPTCTQAGLTEGKHCTVCGEILVSQTAVEALGHDLTEIEYTAPAETEEGREEGVFCSRCDYSEGAAAIPSINDGLVKSNSAPISFNLNPAEMVYDDSELDYPWEYCPELSKDGEYVIKATCNQAEWLCSAISFIVSGEGYLTFDIRFDNDAYMYGDYLQINDYDWDIEEWLSPGDYAGQWVTVGFDLGLSEGEEKEILMEYWSDYVSDGNYDKYCAYLRNFCYSNEDETVSVDVIGSDYGTVSGEFGEESISGSSIVSARIGTTLSLTAEPASGNVFYGWFDENGKYITSDLTIEKLITDDCKYVAMFGTKNHFAVVGQTFCDNLDDAIAIARAGDTIRVLAKEITIDHDLTIPEGVTLVLPCRDADYGTEADGYCPDGTVTTANNDVSSLYSTTTITEGTRVIVKGKLLVNAVTGRRASGGATIYNITGGYALLNNEGTIIVENGGTLDCNGTVAGSGLVYAVSGAKVYENYAIQRWRGGSAAYGSISANVYPIIESEMNSVKCTLRIDSGASLIGNVKVFASGAYNKTRFPQIDNENGIYRLSDGAFVIRTIEWDDTSSTKFNNSVTQGAYRDVYKFFGGMTMANSSINLVGIDVGTDINPLTGDTLFFTVDGDMRFELYDGTYTVKNMFKFLPGFEMKLGENVVLDITSTGGVAMLSESYTTADAGFNQAVSTYPSLRGDAKITLGETSVINNGGVLAGRVIGGTVNRTGGAKTYVDILLMKDNNATVKYTEALKRN